MPPAKDLGRTVSSVNSYCTIILDYLVVRDINIIWVKLKCLHPMFSLVILVRGVGGKVCRLVYMATAKDLGRTVPSVNSYCTIILDYLVVRDINIIWVKLKCLHPIFSLVILVRGVGGKLRCLHPTPVWLPLSEGWGGKLSRLVYLAPHLGFVSNNVIS